MIVGNVFYSKKFVKDLKKISTEIIEIAIIKEKLFINNPLHTSLRLQMLKGDLLSLWSISLTMNYRIIFCRQDNGDIIFISIGKHDIYKNL